MKYAVFNNSINKQIEIHSHFFFFSFFMAQ